MKDRNIVLVGFMGTGKTTIGSTLAKQIGWTFVDTDVRIEEEQGMAVSRLFELRGEVEFRSLETKMLLDVLKGRNQVIATGGGAVLASVNCAAMLSEGLVVALTADYDTIIQRVSGDQARPLLQGNLQERVSALMEQRRSAYDFADTVIDTTKHTIQEVIEIIMDKRKEALN